MPVPLFQAGTRTGCASTAVEQRQRWRDLRVGSPAFIRSMKPGAPLTPMKMLPTPVRRPESQAQGRTEPLSPGRGADNAVPGVEATLCSVKLVSPQRETARVIKTTTRLKDLCPLQVNGLTDAGETLR